MEFVWETFQIFKYKKPMVERIHIFFLHFETILDKI